MADQMVLETQQWVNATYGSVSGYEPCTENGNTGWETIYSLRMGLQHELGISPVAEGFGPATRAAVSGIVGQLHAGYSGNIAKLIQGAFWCKGINPNAFTTDFTGDTVAAFEELQSDAGISTDGNVTVNLMAALFDMSAFVLVSGGDSNIRAMQQTLNANYEAYTGLLPCDGIYQRDTNTALIYALQAEEGIPVGTANGLYGPLTTTDTPTVSEGANNNFVRIIRWGLYVNGFTSAAPFTTSFDSSLANLITRFRQFMILSPLDSSTVDVTVFKGLLISAGDTDRSSIACDTSFQLNASRISALKEAGYEIVGRYLTGTVGNNVRDKNLTNEELALITGAGLGVFPIYQDGASDSQSYFTNGQGASDGQKAIAAASSLGFSSGTVIYFAVDADIQEGDIAGTATAYFEGVASTLNGSGYSVGIYGTRNVCAHIIDAGYAAKAFVSDMSTGYSGNLGFAMPDDWAFDQFAEIDDFSDFAIDKVATNLNRSTATDTVSAGSSASEIYANTLAAANSDLNYYKNNIPALNNIDSFEFKQTLINYTYITPAVTFHWKLKIGGEITNKSSNSGTTYTIENGELTTKTDPIKALLTQNDVFSGDDYDNIINILKNRMSNGEFWIEPAYSGMGFTLHIEKEGEYTNDNIEVTDSYQIDISVVFHTISTELPVIEVTEYNTQVQNLPGINWSHVADSAAIALLAVAGIAAVASGVAEAGTVAAFFTAVVRGLIAIG